MDYIIYDPYNIKDKKQEEKKEKVRCLIINSNNEILITKYGDSYMFPGGKKEDNETISEALKRELKEELGIEFRNDEVSFLTKFISYQKSYPSVENKISDRKITTYYYVLRKDIKIDINKRKLSEREQKGNFKLFWVPIEEVKDYILKDEVSSSNAALRKKYFDEDLLQVLNLYNKSKI